MPFSIIILYDNGNSVDFRLPKGTSKKSTCFSIMYIEKPWVLIRRFTNYHNKNYALFTESSIYLLDFLVDTYTVPRNTDNYIWYTCSNVHNHITGDAWDSHFFIIVLCNYGTLDHNIVKGYGRFTNNNFRCTYSCHPSSNSLSPYTSFQTALHFSWDNVGDL